jgi:hypothetical protein
MAFLSRFRIHKIERTWRYEPGGILWRIVPVANGRIIGEARTEDRSTVKFFCLHERTGRVLWEKKDFGLGWWCGIEGFSSSVLFLHGFASPDLPVHRSVHAIDIETGTLLWSGEDLRFVLALPGALYVEEDVFPGRILAELDPQTGVRRRLWNEGDDPASFPQPPGEAGGRGDPAFPAPFSTMEQLFPDIGPPVSSACTSTGPGATAEVLVDRNLVIACCTAAAGEDGARSVRSSISVIRRDGGRTLYREDISGAGGKHLPDSFFVRDDMLVYIRERTTLTGVDLAPVQKGTMEGKTR